MIQDVNLMDPDQGFKDPLSCSVDPFMSRTARTEELACVKAVHIISLKKQEL